jgi:hypothetical protein
VRFLTTTGKVWTFSITQISFGLERFMATSWKVTGPFPAPPLPLLPGDLDRPCVADYQAISMTLAEARSRETRSSALGKSRAISVRPPAIPQADRGLPYQSSCFSASW